MRAVTYSAYGPADRVLSVSDLPEPLVGPGEVRVALAFSGVNPSDVKRRAGARPGETELPYPQICPHSDGSGTITDVGEGVDAARIGERVWIWNGQWDRALGTAAEAIILRAEQAVALPDGISLETGASLGIPGLTAAHTVLGGGAVKGKNLLIHGGNGSVGHLALQLARWAGARVFATASPKGFERCRAAGAEAVFDYRSECLAQDILDASGGVLMDRIIDVEFGQNIATNAEIIKPCGTISAYGSAGNMTPTLPFGQLLFKAVTVDIVLIYILTAAERQRASGALRDALCENALSCPVSEVFSLEHTAQAHKIVEQGDRTGAILLDVRR